MRTVTEAEFTRSMEQRRAEKHILGDNETIFLDARGQVLGKMTMGGHGKAIHFELVE